MKWWEKTNYQNAPHGRVADRAGLWRMGLAVVTEGWSLSGAVKSLCSSWEMLVRIEGRVYFRKWKQKWKSV